MFVGQLRIMITFKLKSQHSSLKTSYDIQRNMATHVSMITSVFYDVNSVLNNNRF